MMEVGMKTLTASMQSAVKLGTMRPTIPTPLGVISRLRETDYCGEDDEVADKTWREARVSVNGLLVRAKGMLLTLRPGDPDSVRRRTQLNTRFGNDRLSTSANYTTTKRAAVMVMLILAANLAVAVGIVVGIVPLHLCVGA
ncbi:hypothetical protein BM221_010783 [Beauveria bassiana]|uniref:Uncharacterized protein n=1 Tax=Beauveria bassiana TaxID=176275 RepID=A0A2N6N7X5_BEABA|nr:hypothetical protein BM221_010783 [Beauveria bassiana]